MSVFTHEELRYLLSERRLARLATVGPDGTPHVAPVGWSYNRDHDSIDIGGRRLEATKKYRDVARTGAPPWSSTTCCPHGSPAGSKSAAEPKPSRSRPR